MNNLELQYDARDFFMISVPSDLREHRCWERHATKTLKWLYAKFADDDGDTFVQHRIKVLHKQLAASFPATISLPVSPSLQSQALSSLHRARHERWRAAYHWPALGWC